MAIGHQRTYGIALMELHTLVEEERHLTCGDNLVGTIGRGCCDELRSLEVVGEDVDILEVVVAVLRSRLYEHADDEALLIVGIEVVGLIDPRVPVAASGVVLEDGPCGTAVGGIDHAELCCRAAAVANGEVNLHIGE